MRITRKSKTVRSTTQHFESSTDSVPRILAIVVRQFLDSSSSQLTYHGLFSLASQLEPGSLVALFRNSHLAVLYKPEGDDSGIFSLVTDVIFYNETSIVWERLDDVDGGSSTYVDAEFKRSSPAGGDFAGHTAESALAAFEAEAGIHAHFDPAECVLQLHPCCDRLTLSIVGSLRGNCKKKRTPMRNVCLPSAKCDGNNHDKILDSCSNNSSSNAVDMRHRKVLLRNGRALVKMLRRRKILIMRIPVLAQIRGTGASSR